MKTILLQFDTDSHPSSFDRVVAVDAGVDELFSYGSVTPENVTGLVHGAMFTRKPSDLKSTAIFVGGSDVAAGEAVAAKVNKTFFGPVRVSVMMDSNGSNTTAAAAVLAARKHLDLSQAVATVLGGTGPVGYRAAQLLAHLGAEVRLVSRQQSRAEEACDKLRKQSPAARLTPFAATTPEATLQAASGSQLLIAAGAAGVQFLNATQWQQLPGLKVAIDVNAVPPVGLEGLDVMDKATDRAGILCYGAIGVGGTKMKIHSACIKALFESNTVQLDTQAIFEIGARL